MDIATDRTPADNKRYKTLGFRWLCKLSAPHQVRCNLIGMSPAIPNVSYRQPLSAILWRQCELQADEQRLTQTEKK